MSHHPAPPPHARVITLPPPPRPFERLLRKLLTYPNRPALVIFNAYSWFGAHMTHPGRSVATAPIITISNLAWLTWSG